MGEPNPPWSGAKRRSGTLQGAELFAKEVPWSGAKRRSGTLIGVWHVWVARRGPARSVAQVHYHSAEAAIVPAVVRREASLRYTAAPPAPCPSLPWSGAKRRSGTLSRPCKAASLGPWSGAKRRSGTLMAGVMTDTIPPWSGAKRRSGTLSDQRGGSTCMPWSGAKRRSGTLLGRERSQSVAPWSGAKRRSGTLSGVPGFRGSKPWSGAKRRSGTPTSSRTQIGGCRGPARSVAQVH